MSAPTPPRLGRGLAELFGDGLNTLPGTPGGARTIAVTHLEPGPFQPRSTIDPAALETLTASVKAQGILQPLLVRTMKGAQDRYQIVAGERRWRAAQAAGLHTVPVLVRELSDAEAMTAGLVENLQRQDLDPIEEAEGYVRLHEEFSLSHDALGALVGKSRSHIANTIRLLQMSPSLREHVRHGVLSAGHGRALLSHPDQDTAARAVISRGLNVRQTEALVRQAGQPRTPRPETARDPDMEAVEHRLMTQLGLQAKIIRRGEGGTLHIRYTDLDQLDGLVRLLLPDD